MVLTRLRLTIVKRKTPGVRLNQIESAAARLLIGTERRGRRGTHLLTTRDVVWKTRNLRGSTLAPRPPTIGVRIGILTRRRISATRRPSLGRTSHHNAGEVPGPGSPGCDLGDGGVHRGEKGFVVSGNSAGKRESRDQLPRTLAAPSSAAMPVVPPRTSTSLN